MINLVRVQMLSKRTLYSPCPGIFFQTHVEAFSCSSFFSLRKLRFFYRKIYYYLLSLGLLLRFLFFFIAVSEFHLLAFLLLLSPRIACYLCVLHILLVTFTVFTVPPSFIVRFLMFRCLFATYSSLFYFSSASSSSSVSSLLP